MSLRKLTAKELADKAQELQEMEEMLKLKHGLPHLFGYPFYTWARRVFESKNREVLLTAANQISKMIHAEEDIPTPFGFKKMKEIGVGDFVISWDGTPTEVLAVPFRGVDAGYRVTFSDGSSTICGSQHVWICKGYKERFRRFYTSSRNKRKTPNTTYGQWVERTTSEIISEGKYSPTSRPTNKFVIPICKPVFYKPKDLFDPYFLGLWIGNGSSHIISLNNDDNDIASYCLRYGKRYIIKDKSKVAIGFPRSLYSSLPDCVKRKSKEKEIPEEYLTGSAEQRMDLLHGLMDTDGTCDKRGTAYSYSTTSEKLAGQVLELACSLGAIGQIKKNKAGYKKNGKYIACSDCYTVTLFTTFNPFRSARKASRWRPTVKYKHERVIEKIEPVGEIKSHCITVAAEDGSFLCSKNYIVTHNSSTAIRKNIHLATSPKLWKEFWPHLPEGQPPGLFWYMYPSHSVATTEVEEKWVKEFLPRGEYKEHPQFGWKLEYHKNEIHSILFNSGVTIQFKSYSQKARDLQTSSVYHLTCDEELPVELLPELAARLNATSGYFLTVFTATLGQMHWKKAMEPSTADEETHKDALKITASLYDSQVYEDGSPSPWTKEKIARAIGNCPTEAEVQRRIYGRFVKSEGLMYEGFSLEKNMVDAHPLPKTWQVFSGVDPGSGGKSGHPAAMIFLSINPNYREGRVFRGWRGDGIPTTSEDILSKYRELKGEIMPVGQVYDHAAKDFFLIASRSGEAFSPADKGRDRGVAIVNTLFKSGMLKVQRGDHELEKLVNELCSLSTTTKKTTAADDLIDALRYACMAVPWDFSQVDMSSGDKEKIVVKEPARLLSQKELRRDWLLNNGSPKVEQTIEDELDEWALLLE